MKIKNKIFIALAIIFSLFILFSFWYKLAYSMEKVDTYEINQESTQQKILIATQGSEYKEAIVKGIVDSFESIPVYIKVTDVSNLNGVSVDNWNALVILHTWEMWKPQPNAEKFLNEQYNPNKVFVVTTSGSGEENIEGIDAISGASIMEDVPDNVQSLIIKLENAIYLEKE